MPTTADFFQSRLDVMVDFNHPLVVLASRLPWAQIEAEISKYFPSTRATLTVGNSVTAATDISAVTGTLFDVHADADSDTTDLSALSLFAHAASHIKPSLAGRPRIDRRLLISLILLKNTFNMSDEERVTQWSENYCWQYFSGRETLTTKLPCDAAQISRFRTAIGVEGLNALLKYTINTAVAIGAIDKAEFETVIVDSTVQQKAIAYPVDSRLYEIARIKLVKGAKTLGIKPKQTYATVGPGYKFKAGRYAHARQFKRLRSVLKSQRTMLGRLIRDIERKIISQGIVASLPMTAFQDKLVLIKKLHQQRRADKNKVHALHAPEAECIGKGKARSRYEFGVKFQIVVTQKQGLIVGAMTFPGKPYDAHTLPAQVAQTNALLSAVGVAPATWIGDLAYRHKATATAMPEINIIQRGRIKSLTKAERMLLRRRQSIEPIIGHLKSDHRLDRCHLKGALGDAMHGVCCAIGFNVRWLLRKIAIHGVRWLFLRINLLQLWMQCGLNRAMIWRLQIVGGAGGWNA